MKKHVYANWQILPLLTILIVLSNIGAFAQTGRIAGKVSDAKGGL